MTTPTDVQLHLGRLQGVAEGLALLGKPQAAECVREAATLLQSLHDAKERAEEDAERYRWLRESHNLPVNILTHTYEALDAAIDNAREGGRG